MPLYSVEHSFPLKAEQKAALAERITKLHATTFTTPSVYVQVKFHQQDASAHNYFIGGKPKDENQNRIIGFVRTSSTRSKEQFDKLMEQIEHAWYVVLGEDADDEEDKKKLKESTAVQKKAKELVSVTLMGAYMGRELGFAIPEAGKEAEWFKANQKEIERRAELGDENWKDMLEELDSREEMKGWKS